MYQNQRTDEHRNNEIEDSPEYLQAKHRKSEILYTAQVESCRRNGWHVQGDEIGYYPKSNCLLFW